MRTILILLLCSIVTLSYAQSEFKTYTFTYKDSIVECCRPTNEFLTDLKKKNLGLWYNYKACIDYLDTFQNLISEGKIKKNSNLYKIDNYITHGITYSRSKIGRFDKAYKIANKIDTLCLEKEYAYYLYWDKYNDSIQRMESNIKQKERLEIKRRKDSIYQVQRNADNMINIQDNTLSNQEKTIIAIQQNARRSSNNRYGAIYVGYKIEDTGLGMQGFIQRFMNMTQIESGLDKNDDLYIKYVTTSGVPSKYITLKYHCDNEGIIKRMTIFGNYNLVARIFVSYWPTTFQINMFNKSVVSFECLFFSDRITFNYKGGNTAYISISSSQKK